MYVPEWYRKLTDRLMGTCRVCKSAIQVTQYDPRGLWAYWWRNTYCPQHCPDHNYVYDRYEGHYCETCGDHPPYDWYDCG